MRISVSDSSPSCLYRSTFTFYSLNLNLHQKNWMVMDLNFYLIMIVDLGRTNRSRIALKKKQKRKEEKRREWNQTEVIRIKEFKHPGDIVNDCDFTDDSTRNSLLIRLEPLNILLTTSVHHKHWLNPWAISTVNYFCRPLSVTDNPDWDTSGNRTDHWSYWILTF